MIFSKKTILLLAVLFSFIEFTFAQDSGANVGVDYINPRFDFAPIDSLLPKTITFKNVYTAPLKYCSKDEMEELMNGVTYVYVNHFPGKYAYQNKPAEYIFEYITTGCHCK